jgi:hypothetical protein
VTRNRAAIAENAEKKVAEFDIRTASTKSTLSARFKIDDSGGNTGGPVNALTATSRSRDSGTPKLKPSNFNGPKISGGSRSKSLPYQPSSPRRRQARFRV